MQQLGVVHRTIARADQADVEALSAFGVSTIHEAMGRLGSCARTSGPSTPARNCAGRP